MRKRGLLPPAQHLLSGFLVSFSLLVPSRAQHSSGFPASSRAVVIKSSDFFARARSGHQASWSPCAVVIQAVWSLRARSGHWAIHSLRARAVVIRPPAPLPTRSGHQASCPPPHAQWSLGLPATSLALCSSRQLERRRQIAWRLVSWVSQLRNTEAWTQSTWRGANLLQRGIQKMQCCRELHWFTLIGKQSLQ